MVATTEKYSMFSINLLKELSETVGPPGFEDRVRGVILRELSEIGYRYHIDNIGNVYVKIGEGKPVTLVTAHMDEIGFITRYVTDSGFIKVTNLGGVNIQASIGREVVVMARRRDIYGVIGSTPPHLLRDQKKLTIGDLFVDIGVSTREEAENLGVEPGTPITYRGYFRDLGDSVIGKAFDDRVGCFVLLEALRRCSPRGEGTFYIAFTVQEEVGTRGASAIAHRVMPDYGIAIEGTIANDVPGVQAEEWVTQLGRGPALRVMDATIIGERKLVEKIREVAESNGIRYQLQLSPRSGTDAARFILAGAAATAISVPIRYIHSQVSLARKKDIEETIRLLRALLEEKIGN